TNTGTYLTQFGSYGTSPGQLYYTQTLTLDAEGNVYVTANNGIQKFSSDYLFDSRIGHDPSYLLRKSGSVYGIVDILINADNKIQTLEGDGVLRVQTLELDGAYISQFGRSGSDNGSFNTPMSVAIGLDDTAYVADWKNRRIQLFNQDGVYLSQFGTAGTGDGQLPARFNLAVSPVDGTVYVAGGNRVQIFSPNGVYISQFGSAGTGNGQLTGLDFDLTIDQAGYVYVIDGSITTQRIQKFSPSGVYISQFNITGNGSNSNGWGSAGGLSVDSAGLIYVPIDNTYNNIGAIQVFNSDGSYQREIGSMGTGDGQFRGLNDVEVDADGLIYVADTANNRIQVLANDGTYLTQFGSQGFGPTQFYYPQSLAVDSEKNIYITDDANNRVAIYKIGAAEAEAAAPSVPQSVTSVSTQPGAIAANWQAPASDNGSPITGYIVEHRVVGSTGWTSLNVGPLVYEHQILDLPAGSYEVRVSAQNAAGSSPAVTTPAVTVSVTVVNPPTNVPPSEGQPTAPPTSQPAAPQSTAPTPPQPTSTTTYPTTAPVTPETAVSPGGDAGQSAVDAQLADDDGAITVTWPAPEATQPTPSGYSVEIRSDDALPWKEAAAVQSGIYKATIRDLTPADYQVRVSALYPGELSARVVLGVAHITLAKKALPASTEDGQTAEMQSSMAVNGWLIAVCVGLLAAALWFIIIIWKRRRQERKSNR
ncbi:MAG: 6-bladed beta-propeller, partial [Candidatus Saccharimonadales bacterium]